MEKRIRVLIAKPGLDGHDRGAKVIAYALRDAGFEVIYTGLRQTPEQIVNTAIQEGVNIVGLSILSGAHLTMTKRVVIGLREKGGEDIGVIVGGVIPEEDEPKLRELGVTDVFTSGADLDQIAEIIHQRVTTKASG